MSSFLVTKADVTFFLDRCFNGPFPFKKIVIALFKTQQAVQRNVSARKLVENLRESFCLLRSFTCVQLSCIEHL